MNSSALAYAPNRTFQPKIEIEMKVGRFLIKTINHHEELNQAFALRYQVFQREFIGVESLFGFDQDHFDARADHLAIFDEKTDQMIATCRINCSLFTGKFYSELEFDCRGILDRPEIKLELGRVCVHRDFRKGAVILILWRAIAEYMEKTEAKILFGCGSVCTEDPIDTALLYRYLKSEGYVKEIGVVPTDKYRFTALDDELEATEGIALTPAEILRAQALLPSLCKSYFDIGCYTPGLPAIDTDFKCIDFLTVLESEQLNSRVRRRMFGVV